METRSIQPDSVVLQTELKGERMMKKWYNVANDGPFNSMCWQAKDGNFFKLVLTLSGWELWFVSQATGRERLLPPTGNGPSKPLSAGKSLLENRKRDKGESDNAQNQNSQKNMVRQERRNL